MRSLLCASRNNDLLRFEFLSSHLAGFRPAGSHCEKSGKSDDTCASARSGCAKQRSLLCPLSERRWRHPLLFAVLDLLVLLDQAKSTEERKCTTEEIDSYFGKYPVLSIRRFLQGASLPPFGTKRWRQKCPQGTSVGIGQRLSLSDHERLRLSHDRSGRSILCPICCLLRCNAEAVVRSTQRWFIPM